MNQKDRLRIMRQIIKLKISKGNLISMDNIVGEAKDKGFKEYEAEEILMELKRLGDIYEPKKRLIGLL